MTSQNIELTFSNRELALIEKAAMLANMDIKTFIRQVANNEPKDYTNPIHHLIIEAVNVAFTKQAL